MKYEVINLETWERGGLFKFYIDNLRNVMSLTADINVTKLVDFVRSNNLKFYPSAMWIISKAINAHDEFKYGWNKNGNLIRWDFVSPYYADFHKEDNRFVKLVAEYSDDLFDFHSRFLAGREKNKNLRGFDLSDIPPNVFDVSCLPWLKYKNFDIHVFDDGKYLAPVVTWGKFETENNNCIMPLSMNIHHAVADGFHLCRFFIEVQEIINNLS